jgi:hypothetical protein
VKRQGGEARQIREEVMELEAARLRLSGKVMKGDEEAFEEDRRLERRIRELANHLTPGQEEEREEELA